MAAGSMHFTAFESFIGIAPVNASWLLMVSGVRLEVKQDQRLTEPGNSESEHPKKISRLWNRLPPRVCKDLLALFTHNAMSTIPSAKQGSFLVFAYR
jgi:hypothetical protein